MFSLSKSNFSPVSLTLPLFRCGIRELRQRIHTVQTTQKITEAMKLVAAATVRRAQEVVVNDRLFASNLAEMLNDVTQRLKSDDVSTPLTDARPVKTVALVVFTGDYDLCGSFNKWVIKWRFQQRRLRSLLMMFSHWLCEFLRKEKSKWHKRAPRVWMSPMRPKCPLCERERSTRPVITRNKKEINWLFLLLGQMLGYCTLEHLKYFCKHNEVHGTGANDVFSLFVVYTRFVSLVRFEPVVQTLLPLG
ncbi:ATP synthase gamma chain, chloroplastic-like [Vigna radiata var. radiata]|uniref:ATP synthase gamma chain, chloroplastic-like n=1 Tax=Vigna radiata var. radiata TaxID=3916 RepID=A0A1S3U5S6_VIGRR|nr:ATP synthase gamma chain, chloroplastic-like [Vigna radiata var. radiata]